MCGIAGMIDLSGRRSVPVGALEAMAAALVHRGPDEDGFLVRPGLGFASRRLSIVGLGDGRQPIANEDRTVSVVLNGELFDYPEVKADLEKRGHRFATHCDTELLPHLWEEYGDNFLTHTRGQFAFALYDERQRRVLLARDRFGIAPLYWTRQRHDGGEWLLFASEIKALLASGLVRAAVDVRGLNHVFSCLAQPGPATCFAGVQSLLPGHCLGIQLGAGDDAARVTERTYWAMDFPPEGEEDHATPLPRLVEEFEARLLAAVERRLRADVPVVSYLSGGVDSGIVVALACKALGRPIPTFTIQITDPKLDETREADQVARHVGARSTVVEFGAQETLTTYPRLIRAAECPVVDTSCAALLLLAQAVHGQGFKVALTGEGSDEWLCGYPWYKTHRLLSWLDVIPGLRLSHAVRRAYLKWAGAPAEAWPVARQAHQLLGGHNPWMDLYGLITMGKWGLFSRGLLDQFRSQSFYHDLGIPEQLKRWHPLNRGVWLAGRTHLAGLLLAAKGDRVAMHSSVETRYPFLDEEVFAFLAKVPPKYKLHGLRDKFLLRHLAQRWLPKEVAWRRKAMFRAPFDSFHADHLPPFVDQLLSEESLRKTGYFDPAAVAGWRQRFRSLPAWLPQRMGIEMGLAGVVATQLWHHTFLDGSLADLPSAERGARNAERSENADSEPSRSALPVPR